MAAPQLGNVPAGKAFWCKGGRVVNNLDELAAALREMSPETFSHHVTANKNDFSIWVRDVIGDVMLARQLYRAANHIIAARQVETRLKELRSS